jgi:glutamine amidotransferase
MRIAIVRYNAGNVRSVANSLCRLGVEPIVTDDPGTLRAADKVIFPGVGEASSAMRYLRDRRLDIVIASLEQPVLAICLGMHLLCEASEENDTKCLGLLPQKVRRFPDDKLKVPHVGWNTLSALGSPLFNGIPENAYMYFVHSYFVEIGGHTIAETEYGTRFSAAARYGNFFAVQFHPERSGAAGEQILKNFLSI